MNTPQSQLDPRTHEASKTQEERAEDIAYTLNHAISCGATDIAVQPIASVLATTLVHEDVLPKWLHWITNIFEKEHHHGHGDHDHDHHHHHEHCDHHPTEHEEGTKWQRVMRRMKGELQWKKLSHNLGHWFTGEVTGDVGGILPTIIVQRTAPGFMDGMRRMLEPVAGGFFRKGAERDARHWGERRGLASDSPQVQQKEATLYEHEISHLPQAVVWNVFSIPINYITQWAMSKPGHRFTVREFLIGKTFGTLFSNTVLIGGRGIAPETFNEWDRWNSENVLRPVLDGPGKLLGIDKKTADKVMRQHEENRGDTAKQWQGRLENEPAPTSEPQR